MHKISWWAKMNPWKTRIIIVIIYILVAVLATIAGNNLLALGIPISGGLLIAGCLLLITGMLFYPGKKQKNGKPALTSHYTRRKTADCLLAFSAFLLIASIGNEPGDPFVLQTDMNQAAAAASSLTPVPVAPVQKNASRKKVKIKFTRTERRAILKELKKLLKQSFMVDKEKDLNRETRIGLIVLTIIGGVVLSMLLAGLSCSIACSGSEALALVVLILGAAGIAVLWIAVIKAINRRYPPLLVPADEPVQSAAF